MPKSDEEIMVECEQFYWKDREAQDVVDPATFAVACYRLAESEKESEIALLSSSNLSLKQAMKAVAEKAEADRKKYDKLVEGLRDLPKGEIRSNGKGGQLLMPPEYVLSYSAIESLITEIEGVAIPPMEKGETQ